jgi:hypothetical protein
MASPTLSPNLQAPAARGSGTEQAPAHNTLPTAVSNHARRWAHVSAQTTLPKSREGRRQFHRPVHGRARLSAAQGCCQTHSSGKGLYAAEVADFKRGHVRHEVLSYFVWQAGTVNALPGRRSQGCRGQRRRRCLFCCSRLGGGLWTREIRAGGTCAFCCRAAARVSAALPVLSAVNT